MATVFLTVGLPAAGKTTRARVLEREHDALRLTTDHWVHALFGPSNPPQARDALEGQLLATALRVAQLGTDVVLDFGVWSREERDAIRHLVADVGARCVLEFCDVSPAEQWERVQRRWRERPHETFAMTVEDLTGWRAQFDVPTVDELHDGPVPAAPQAFTSWGAWAADRWPGFRHPTSPVTSPKDSPGVTHDTPEDL